MNARKNPFLTSKDAKAINKLKAGPKLLADDNTSNSDDSESQVPNNQPDPITHNQNFELEFTFSYTAPRKTDDPHESKDFDNIILYKDPITKYTYFGVFNPHGSTGSEVVLTLKKFIIQHLSRNTSTIRSLVSKTEIKKFLGDMILLAESNFHKRNIDLKYSGCTINHIFIYKNHYFTINVGNSRAILYRNKPSNKFAIELSTDHIPENKEERYRIYKHGGIIKRWEANNEKEGPLRIWDKKIENGPGIRVTRSIGDMVATGIGVISKPDIECLEIGEFDAFICISTEAIFRNLYSTQVCYYIDKFLEKYPHKADSTAQFLINKVKEKTLKSDGITVSTNSETQFGYANVKDSAVIIAMMSR